MYASDLKHPDQTLEDKLHQLYNLNRNKAIDLSFRPPFLNLLKNLGNPHLNLPPVIHVAGTNGKGSIIAMLRSVLEEADYNVHAYTSPHLISFNERIVLAGNSIENGLLETLIDEALELNADGELTFFEITTAIALAAFSRTPADICLLEVGMGGRLDCTNVIENPLISVINAIGYDHAEHLGDTITEIAAEKAGIMKRGVPCVIGHQPHTETLKIFETNAANLDVPLHHVQQEQTLATALRGPHQQQNMAACLKVLALLQETFPVNQRQIKTGLETAHWPARLQKLNPVDFGLAESWEIYLDGGHNKDAGKALSAQAALWKEDGKPLSVILGMMKGKDAEGFLTPLMPFIDHLNIVNIENEPQSQSAKELKRIFPEGQVFDNFQDALHNIKSTQTNAERILICGSLYLAGQVLSHVLQERVN